MITETERAFLQKELLQNQQQLQYYLSLAVILLLLSWGIFFALQRNGSLIIAVILSIGIWYYPWRYYKKVNALKSDLSSGEKLFLTTTVYGKGIRKINRLQPYYYLYTDDEDFEVSKAIYNALDYDQRIKLAYTPTSKTILKIDILTTE